MLGHKKDATPAFLKIDIGEAKKRSSRVMPAVAMLGHQLYSASKFHCANTIYALGLGDILCDGMYYTTLATR
jgi:hypothetical protein